MTPQQHAFFLQLDQMDLMARTMWGEARGESEIGRLAVGFVILNRVRDMRWGFNVHDVVLAKWQFSCFNEGDPNLPKLMALDSAKPDPDPVYEQCLKLASQILLGEVSDPTHGATHYHALGVRPSWAGHPKMRYRGRIKNHLFYFEER